MSSTLRPLKVPLFKGFRAGHQRLKHQQGTAKGREKKEMF